MTDWRKLISKGEPFVESELLELIDFLKDKSHMGQSPGSDMALLQARLALEQLWAVRKFDRASTKLMIFGIALSIATIILAVVGFLKS